MNSCNIYEGNEGEINRVDNLREKNLIFLFLGVIALMCVMLPTVFKNNKLNIIIIEMIGLFFKLGMFASVLVAYKVSRKVIFIYLEIIFGIISIINIAFLITIVGNSRLLNSCYIFQCMLNCIFYTSAIVFSQIVKDTINNKTIKATCFIYGIIPLILVILIGIYQKSFGFYSNGLSSIVKLTQLVFIAMLLVCLIILYKNSSKLKDMGIFNKLVIADVMLMISHTLYLPIISFSYPLCMISNIFLLIGNIIICDVVIKVALKNELSNLHKIIDEKEEEINSLRSTYEEVFQSMSDGVIIRENNNVIFVNDSMIEMTKACSSEKFKGFNVIKLIGNEYIKKFKQYNKMVCEGQKVDKIKEELICFDGNRVMVEVSSTRINMNGKSMVLSVIKDISKQMKAIENEKALIEAKNKDKLRGEFFANISHELRTPINVIYSSLQVIQMHMEKDNINNEKIDCYMKVIKQNCYRLLRIISNLIDITKIEAGFLKPNISRCEIISLVENISMSIVTYLHEKNMELVFDTDIEEEYIDCDPDMIERVMLNLFSNAVKFRKNNGHVWVNMHDAKDGNITIEVKDDGIGIAEEKQHLIFKRFTQVDSSLIRRSKGSGIGLSLVKSIIEMNSGTIRFESKENVGTKFIIKLPANENEVMQEYSNVKSICDSSIDNTKEKVNIEFADICN